MKGEFIFINKERLEERVFEKLLQKGYSPTSQEVANVTKAVLESLDELYIESIESDLDDDFPDELIDGVLD